MDTRFAVRVAPGCYSGAFPPAALRELRQSLGLTQTQLAEALGISRPSIARYEAGTLPIPQVVALACEALKANRPASA